MRLNEADVLKLLPRFMRPDESIQGLSAGVNPAIRDLAARIRLMSTWDKLEELSESELDELAWELNISWYYLATDVAQKRRVIRSSDLVHARMGTKWAVEEVVTAIFGSGVVKEWYEYGGQPYYFKILSGNPSITTEKIDQFMRLLELVKRKSAWLESIVIALAGEMHLYSGIVRHEITREIHRLGIEAL